MKAFIVEARRTPIGRSHPEKGALRGIRADELLAGLLRDFNGRVMNAATIGDFYAGCVGQHLEQGKNVARLALLLAGYPSEIPGVTINRLCGSSLQAINFAAVSVGAGREDAILAGGVEHMQHVPMTAAIDYNQKIFESFEFPFTNMGLTAEKVAMRYGITRAEQDAFALESHRRAIRAAETGAFAQEIVPVTTSDGPFAKDQSPRAETSMDVLAALKPAFREDGSVTAGNSCGLGDGASLTLIASEGYCRRHSLKPLAEIVDHAVVGIDPTVMGLGPVPAIRKVLDRSKLSVNDVGLFEINEAFAAQAIACMRELDLDPGRVNVRGGAIALGHPLGATGARIATTLVHALADSGREWGVAAMCIGHGQGIATLVRRGQ